MEEWGAYKPFNVPGSIWYDNSQPLDVIIYSYKDPKSYSISYTLEGIPEIAVDTDSISALSFVQGVDGVYEITVSGSDIRIDTDPDGVPVLVYY